MRSVLVVLIALTASLSLGLASCSSDPEPSPDDTGDNVDADVDTTEEDSGRPDIPEFDAADIVTRPDVVVDAPDTGDADQPECRFAADCPTGWECVQQECLQRCARDIECDDLNVCTENVCERGYCQVSVITPAPVVGDPVVGDCRQDVCIAGNLETVPDRDDAATDDGIACTLSRCAGLYPVHDPNNGLCDDGDPENGEEVCSLPAGGCALGDRPHWFCEELLPGWGPTEVCGDGLDNDGNGEVDEGCPCVFGEAQRCYDGPPASRAQGGCLDGFMLCVDRDNPHWGPCEGSVGPSPELCDLKDNDCNGCVDDLPDCDPILTCPAEDFARPLRDYPLDATAIFDVTSGSVLRAQWTIVAPSNSATRQAADPTALQTSMYLDVSGDYYVSLELETDKGLLGCSWVVHAAGSGLRVEMRWDTFGEVDMDLHLHRSGTETGFCSDDDCYYANCTPSGFGVGPEWGYTDSPPSACDDGGAPCNNPRLDIDNIRGFDPENINIDNPRDGDKFRVMAHMFSGDDETRPIVTIYCGGRLRAVLGEDPDPVVLTDSSSGCQGQTWRAADVTMAVDPSGYVDCDVDVLTDGSGDWDVRMDDASY